MSNAHEVSVLFMHMCTMSCESHINYCPSGHQTLEIISLYTNSHFLILYWYYILLRKVMSAMHITANYCMVHNSYIPYLTNLVLLIIWHLYWISLQFLANFVTFIMVVERVYCLNVIYFLGQALLPCAHVQIVKQSVLSSLSSTKSHQILRSRCLNNSKA